MADGLMAIAPAVQIPIEEETIPLTMNYQILIVV